VAREIVFSHAKEVSMSELRVMDETGDSRYPWTPEDSATARELFYRLRKQGYLLYEVEGDGKGTVIREFNPEAKTVVAVPRIVGG
jgi:hypothetical protein